LYHYPGSLFQNTNAKINDYTSNSVFNTNYTILDTDLYDALIKSNSNGYSTLFDSSDNKHTNAEFYQYSPNAYLTYRYNRYYCGEPFYDYVDEVVYELYDLYDQIVQTRSFSGNLKPLINTENDYTWVINRNTNGYNELQRISTNQFDFVAGIGLLLQKQLYGLYNRFVLFTSYNSLRLTRLTQNGQIDLLWGENGIPLCDAGPNHILSNASFSMIDGNLIVSIFNLRNSQLILANINPSDCSVVNLQTFDISCHEMPVINFIDNKLLISFIHSETNYLNTKCFELTDNSWNEAWIRSTSIMPVNEYDVKRIGNKLLYAYASSSQNTSRIYLKTLDLNGYSDQQDHAYFLPNLCNNQIKPMITVIGDDTAFINRLEYNNELCKALVYDLISTNHLATDQETAQALNPVISINNYPNPFNQNTQITWEMNKQANVEINIYNIKGQKVKQLYQSTANRGMNSLDWNSKDDSKKSLPSGIYFIRLKSEGHSSVRKILLLK
jgi:hypothetical protein